jgi:hypothetical protein
LPLSPSHPSAAHLMSSRGGADKIQNNVVKRAHELNEVDVEKED